MPSVIKRGALESFQAAIEAAVPALAGHTHVWAETPTSLAEFPCLALIARGKWRFEPFQSYVAYTPLVAGTQVEVVGEVHGTVEMQLVATSDYEREVLEDAIDHLFYSREGSPGVVVRDLTAILVNGTEIVYSPSAAFTHEGEEWRDEFLFSNQRWRFMDVGVSLPALVARSATIIDHLFLGLTNDLAGNVAQESVEVLQDGSTVKEF